MDDREQTEHSPADWEAFESGQQFWLLAENGQQRVRFERHEGSGVFFTNVDAGGILRFDDDDADTVLLSRDANE